MDIKKNELQLLSILDNDPSIRALRACTDNIFEVDPYPHNRVKFWFTEGFVEELNKSEVKLNLLFESRKGILKDTQIVDFKTLGEARLAIPVLTTRFLVQVLNNLINS